LLTLVDMFKFFAYFAMNLNQDVCIDTHILFHNRLIIINSLNTNIYRCSLWWIEQLCNIIEVKILLSSSSLLNWSLFPCSPFVVSYACSIVCCCTVAYLLNDTDFPNNSLISQNEQASVLSCRINRNWWHII